MSSLQLQLRLRKMLDDSPTINFSGLARRKDTKKDGAQKFYSLLVLQKVNLHTQKSIFSLKASLQFQAVELDQDQHNIYADLSVAKGISFDMDATAAAK